MRPQEINTLHKAINKHIHKHELKMAFDSLRLLINQAQNWELSQRLSDMETSYRFLLRYLVDGVTDPERSKVYQNLLASAYEVTDDVSSELLSELSGNFFYERLRTNKSLHFPSLIHEINNLYEEISLTHLLEEGAEKKQKIKIYTNLHDQILTELFERVWTFHRAKEPDIDSYRQLMSSSLLDMEDKAQIISALLLNLMLRFDENNLMILFDAYENSDDEQIRQRALIGIMLVLYLFDKRIPLYPKINNRLSLLSENPVFRLNVRTVIIQFIRSRETEQITRKIHDEILPGMMKVSSVIRNKLNMDDLNEPGSLEEKNPEWQEIFDDAGLTDKLQEFTDMQLEGSDVFMSTFANLKSFPFFYNTSHWFLPFNINYALLNDNLRDERAPDFLNMITQSNYLCSSDKYSFYFSIMQMPENYRNMTVQQFKAEGSEMRSLEKEEELLSGTKKAENISKQYIQDLYRFFKLHPRRKDFVDIFSLPLNFHQTYALSPIVSDSESLRIIAEFYFKKNFFKDAEEIFTQLSTDSDMNNELFEKIGYCRQMSDDYAGALDAYLQADIIKPDKFWTMRRIAGCYRQLNHPEKALEYYRRMEQIQPENLTVQLNLGHCLFELKRYDEALKYYFKVEYLDEKRQKALRPIAWCSFLSGKLKQAQKYFTTILLNKPDAQDYMNAGHAEWAAGNRKRAIQLYLQSIRKNENNIDRFMEDFEKDIPDLETGGIRKDEIYPMLDQLQYEISMSNDAHQAQ
ncbi:MAG: tetratricopeptide repeat protein [Candidatus Azobacteroides sp.]|nr:tetratricopeptide repeat protein [Candidatus Azobacteroides sp.]